MREGTGNFQNGDLLYMATHPVADAIRIGRTKPYECSYPVVESNPRIPVSERLPEELVPVNVTWINRNPEPYYAEIKDVPFACTAVYYNGKWYWWSSVCTDYLEEYGEYNVDLVDKYIDIVAWMPLPETYRESEVEDGEM